MDSINFQLYEGYMRMALELASKAGDIGEVPVGCVIADTDGRIIGHGYNQRSTMKNALYHAEIAAINEACIAVGDWRLEGCTLIVTIEPCPMCAGAIVQARVKTVVFGARNKKAGCAGSILNILDEKRFNHQVEIIEGVLHDECSATMSDFFKKFRAVNEK